MNSTREEMITKWYDSKNGPLVRCINQIYDDIESRICSSCDHGEAYDGDKNEDVYSCIPLYDASGGMDIFVPGTFGCNQFKKSKG